MKISPDREINLALDSANRILATKKPVKHLSHQELFNEINSEEQMHQQLQSVLPAVKHIAHRRDMLASLYATKMRLDALKKEHQSRKNQLINQNL